MLYTPAGVPGATLTCPVVVSNTTPGFDAGVVTASVALPVAPKVGMTPFNVSFVNALPALGLPAAVVPPLKLSFPATKVAKFGGPELIVKTAVSQTAAFGAGAQTV